MSVIHYLLILTLYVTQNEAAKILAVFPVPFVSHQFAFRPLTQELAKRGHEVTIITTDPAFPKGEAPVNLKEIDIHEMAYETMNKFYSTTSSGRPDILLYIKIGFELIKDIMERLMEYDVITDMIKNEKYDLVFTQNIARSALIFGEIFKAPTISISSFTPMTFDVSHVGAAWHPLLYPSNMSKKMHNLTMHEKLDALWSYYKFESVIDEINELENELIKKLLGPNSPSLNQLKNKVDMLFLNCHSIWDNNRPVPPNTIYLGGMQLKPEKQLPTDLKKYLDSSKNGVIYMSLGSNVKPSLFPATLLESIVKVFSKLPYDVLWKFDGEKLPGLPKNVKLSKWLPQSDLLRHPKIKLFITQGGLQSTEEAIAAGVPLIGIPINSDQHYNVEQYLRHNIGVKLDLNDLTEENFREAILGVVNNEQYYRSNLTKLKDMVYDQPMQPLERAVWWTEYVIRHGGAKHLRSPAANMPWTEYYEIELLATVFAVIIFVLAIVITIIEVSFKKYCLKKGKAKRH